jgi:hypothetical protein
MTLPPSIKMQRIIDKAIIHNSYLVCLRVNRPCGVDEMRRQIVLNGVHIGEND